MTTNELWEALDGLFAYDEGATDSGIRDGALRAECIAVLDGMNDDERRLFLARGIRDNYLSESGLEQGYGVDDAVDFVRWLNELSARAARGE